MEEVLEIVLRAIDNASDIFSSVTSSAEEMGTGFDDIETAATGATGSIQDVIDYCQNIDGSGPADAASGMDELGNATTTADGAVQELGTNLDIINAGMLLQTAEQISNIAGNAEGMAQEMNSAAITVGQLATQTGIAEPQMVSLINNISNATFPNDEAMMYVKGLSQMGVEAGKLGDSATNLDKINDAFQMGAPNVMSMANELKVLGVDMNNVSTAFNALAYANANTSGGMQTFTGFLRKFDVQFKELGFDVDQSAVIIAAASKQFGAGRPGFQGLSKALEECDGNVQELEKSLGLAPGTLENASAATGQYEGELQQLANEEMEHKTILDQLGAAWEDVSLAVSGFLSPLGSAIGLIGQVGSFGMQVNGLMMLGGTLRTVVQGIRDFNIVKGVQNLLEGEGAIASLASAVGITTEAAAAEGATFAFAGLAVAEGAALWPILAIIAAIALLVVAVYEIGKAFGWWNDVGTMFEAISAGIQRLWSAFINHPDVQAVISGISWALGTLWSLIVQAGQAVLEFFGINEEGNFDFVRSLIDGIGLAWQTMTAPIRLVISLVQMVINAFNNFTSGQSNLPGTIWTIMLALVNAYATIWSMIINGLAKFAGQMLQRGLSMASNFVNGIINRLRALPGRVYSALVAVVSRISSAIQAWISTAKSKVSSLISSITSPFQGVAGAISSALSGVANALTAPFRQAWSWIEPYYNKIKDALNIIPSFGGEAAYGGETAMSSGGQAFNINTGEYVVSDNQPLVIEDNVNVTLDLQNVPSTINTDQLISALQDRSVLSAIAGNRDFQSIDANVKKRISLRNARRG